MNPKIRETASGGGATTTHLKSELHCDEREVLVEEVIVMLFSDGVSMDGDGWTVKMGMDMMEETMMIMVGVVVVVDVEKREALAGPTGNTKM